MIMPGTMGDTSMCGSSVPIRSTECPAQNISVMLPKATQTHTDKGTEVSYP